ncbi:stalk domain-containing protein [Cohnella fermenti]|uniref:Copper amine oxidase-like N-terminal domain-containing protein n=1 Tax=Cohnella fermenti TaxID=2565925 RepID=A0A4S4C8A8_9BACL|nr:stalk domain-containing protein [Cohnella fermenti]THF84177.1 hypothetical protein E6C55_02450 [Cohnella fermenti]
MRASIAIPPGTPDDDNRDYLPEAIRGSDIVVNENGNNSRTYPEGLAEFREKGEDGLERVWYEYVPSSYDGTQEVPLVVSFHGGLMTGWGQAVYSSWTLIAEREGFIVLFPNATERRIWMVECERKTLDIIGKPNPSGFYMHTPPDNPDDNRDMSFVLSLIARLGSRYRIDRERIYAHGMSMGDIMASQMARYHGGVFAGQAGAAGLTWPEVLFDERGEPNNRTGPLPVWQSRMEHDSVPLNEEHTAWFVRRNRDYWKRLNGCESLPAIRIEGENNFAFYSGERADYVFHEAKNRDHGQTFDDAELVWSRFFSGWRREEAGRLARSASDISRQGDEFAIAVACGCDKAYVINGLIGLSGSVIKRQKRKYHGLNGEIVVRGEYLLTPATFVSELFAASFDSAFDGRSVRMTLKDGRTLQFAEGSIGCVVDGRVMSMHGEAVFTQGQLYVPLRWIGERLYSLHVSFCDDVLYLTDHDAQLSLHMAKLIRDEILCDPHLASPTNAAAEIME